MKKYIWILLFSLVCTQSAGIITSDKSSTISFELSQKSMKKGTHYFNVTNDFSYNSYVIGLYFVHKGKIELGLYNSNVLNYKIDEQSFPTDHKSYSILAKYHIKGKELFPFNLRLGVAYSGGEINNELFEELKINVESTTFLQSLELYEEVYNHDNISMTLFVGLIATDVEIDVDVDDAYSELSNDKTLIKTIGLIHKANYLTFSPMLSLVDEVVTFNSSIGFTIKL